MGSRLRHLKSRLEVENRSRSCEEANWVVGHTSEPCPAEYRPACQLYVTLRACVSLCMPVVPVNLPVAHIVQAYPI